MVRERLARYTERLFACSLTCGLHYIEGVLPYIRAGRCNRSRGKLVMCMCVVTVCCGTGCEKRVVAQAGSLVFNFFLVFTAVSKGR